MLIFILINRVLSLAWLLSFLEKEDTEFPQEAWSSSLEIHHPEVPVHLARGELPVFFLGEVLEPPAGGCNPKENLEMSSLTSGSGLPMQIVFLLLSKRMRITGNQVYSHQEKNCEVFINLMLCLLPFYEMFIYPMK